jgi:glycosyltransferase involved in cell wall biosynthesis
MRILVVSSLYTPQVIGGAERVAQLFAEGMRDRGHEVAVVTTSDAPSEVRMVNGLPVHAISMRNVYPLYPRERHRLAEKAVWHLADAVNVGMARELMAVVRQQRPDVVHTHNITGFGPLIWRAVRKAGIPIVHSVHDSYVLCAGSHMFAFGRNCDTQHLWCRVYSQPAKRWSRSVTTLVGASRFIVDRHRAYGAFEGVPDVVIGNPYPFTRPAPRRSSLNDRLRLGFLGRVEPVKGIEVLLSGLRASPSRGWELDVAGTGPTEYVEQLRSRFAGDRVRFVGQVKADEFLPSLDALVVPSLGHDTFGMNILEAHACGVPVIASRRGGFPELVTDGETGFLFDPDSEGELTAILEGCLSERGRLADMAGPCRANAARFAPDQIFSQYEAVYSEAVLRLR